MSTGLTWVYISDYGNPGISGNGLITFNDYNEALDWSLYTARSLWVNVTPNPGVLFIIYTTSPNNNGYVDASSASPSFIPYD